MKLAEDGTNFAEWLRKLVDSYLGEGRESKKVKEERR
jgi:hypothetical protein